MAYLKGGPVGSRGQTPSSPDLRLQGLLGLWFSLFVGFSRATSGPVILMLTHVAVLSSASLYVNSLPPALQPMPDLGLGASFLELECSPLDKEWGGQLTHHHDLGRYPLVPGHGYGSHRKILDAGELWSQMPWTPFSHTLAG